MRRFTDSAVAALGMTTLCNLWMLSPLVSPDHNAIYHWSGRVSALFLPTVLDFCLFWLLTTLLLLWAGKSERGRIAAWCGFAVLLPWILLKNWSVMAFWRFPHGFSAIVLSLCLIVILALVIFWNPAQRPRFERFQRLMSHMLSVAAMIGIFVLCELAWFAWQARHLNDPLPLHSIPQTAATSEENRPPIIWILLDELSYRQVYDHRFNGLSLPAFDQLAQESSVFTHVIPAGIMTEIVLPSLMTGQPIDNIRSSANGMLSIHNPRTNAWTGFDQHGTIFQDAQSAGYKTGLAGWYNPYCRLLPQVLDSCFWTAQLTALTTPYRSHFHLADLIYSKTFHLPDAGEDLSLRHLSDYRSLFAAADTMLEDSSTNLLFLHMPVPHPGGIYHRATGEFATKNSTYIDNLALADSYLAHVRSLLERDGRWNSSTVIIMGDHSWRTKLLWTANPDWTQEEQIASDGGQFDDRPGYIVKLPGQHTGARIDTPFAATNTRQLMDEIIYQKIQSPEQLSAWVTSVRPR